MRVFSAPPTSPDLSAFIAIVTSCASAVRPILGDPLYGVSQPGLSRMALHAWRIEFTHPVTGEPLWFESPVPEELARLSTTP